MRPRTMKDALRKVRTMRQVDELLRHFSPAWAGTHKGRRRVVAMLRRKRREMEDAQ